MSDLQIGQTPAPGIYYDVPDDVYFSLNATSKSDLLLLDDSPLTFKSNKLGLIPDRETKSMNLGKALHMYLLQPKEFSRCYSRPLTREVCERDGMKLVDDREKILEMVADLNAQRQQQMIDDGCIMDTDTLIGMLEAMNQTRQAKLTITGTKPVLIERILDNQPNEHWTQENLEGLKGDALKEILQQLNTARDGLLSTNGSRVELTERVRENLPEGQGVITAWEHAAAYEELTGHPYQLGSGNSRHDMVAWLNACEYKGGGWMLWDQVVAAWKENNPDKILLSDEQFAHLNGMRDSLMNNRDCAKLLWPEKPHLGTEVVIIWNDPATGELCKGKIDALRHNYMPIDVKTARSAQPDEFDRAVQNYAYDMQEAHYLNGLEVLIGRRPSNMPFVVVEPEPPYLCKAYVLHRKFKYIGAGRIFDLLTKLAYCRKNNDWPGLGDDVGTVEPARYYEQKYQQHIPEDYEE